MLSYPAKETLPPYCFETGKRSNLRKTKMTTKFRSGMFLPFPLPYSLWEFSLRFSLHQRTNERITNAFQIHLMPASPLAPARSLEINQIAASSSNFLLHKHLNQSSNQSIQLAFLLMILGQMTTVPDIHLPRQSERRPGAWETPGLTLPTILPPNEE